jgi:PAS domain S-box-containing protein
LLTRAVTRLRRFLILAFFEKLFGTDFMPRVDCLRDPAVVGLHAISDLSIAIAYYFIPFSLLLLVRHRHDLAFRRAYVLFGVFIFACGATHLVAVVTLWYPVYRLEGVIKLATAIVSGVTAVLLIRLVPEAIALPGPERISRQLRTAKARTAELAAALDRTQSLVRDPDGTISFWSSGAQLLYGWSQEEALGSLCHELLRTEFPRPRSEIDAELRERGVWVGELKHQRRDGRRVWVASHWALQMNPDDSSASVVEVNNDITALKHAEDALRSSEATARSLLENASQGILTVDNEGIIVDANLMLKDMFGYRQGELIGRSIDILLPEGLRSRHAEQRENYMGRRKDGSEFPVEISLNHMTGQRVGLAMAFVSDISARQQASLERERLVASLEGALAEKTVLVKEVHHRVKNNLAVIAGLLDMQSLAVDDARASNALVESEQRVRSMALIHEHLYATEDLSGLNFADYAEHLARELCISFAVDSDRLRVLVDAQPLELGVGRAIPCGLILNELLTNAIKYAYPGEAAGEIRIRFARVAAGRLSLSCEDDGAGVPEALDWRNAKSMGLRIINVLTKQIEGELLLDRSGGGTRFELTFNA